MKSPEGFLFSAVNAGVKSPETKKLDIGLVLCNVPANAAAVFTTNKVKAAPVLIGMDIIKNGTLSAVIANSGNANACTGQEGIEDAREIIDIIAEQLQISPDEVFPMSTGVIGVRLPVDRIRPYIAGLIPNLSANPEYFAEAIMTTDTFSKIVSKSAGKATVLGMAKGSGMIAPDMATTLAVVLTDASITSVDLNRIIKEAVKYTFNAICVDNDTSTNDTLVALSSCMIREELSLVEAAIKDVIKELAIMLVKDGEGATKIINLKISGCRDESDAIKVGKAVANSMLVKTAIFGSDPNWGRIMCAAGYSGAQFNPDKVSIKISGMDVVDSGKESDKFNEDVLHNLLKQKEIKIEIDLHEGSGNFEMWTSDLSYKYVEINSSYRS